MPTSNEGIFSKLLDQSPVLRSEDRESYDMIRDRFFATLDPQDILAAVLVDWLVKDFWLPESDQKAVLREAGTAFVDGFLAGLGTRRRISARERATVEAIAKALEVPAYDLFYFEKTEDDPKLVRRRLETVLSKCTPQQIKQIYGHARCVVDA